LATETDALSTALLLLGSDGHGQIASLRPGMRTFLMLGAKEGFRVEVRRPSHPERGLQSAATSE